MRIIPMEHRDIITGSTDPEQQDLADPIIEAIPVWDGFFSVVILPLFLCLSLCFSSCQDNELPEPPVEDLVPLSFSVTIEGNEDNTRTAINGTNIVWVDGDKITLFDGTGNREFTYSASDHKFNGEALAHKTTYQAIYPYSSVASSHTGSLYNTVTISAEQQAIKGTFDKSFVPMIAYVDATDKKLHFCWAFSLMKIEVPSGASYTKIVVSNYSSTGTESYLSGTATVSYNAGVSITKSTGSSSVSLVPASGTTIGEGTYYLSIFPCSLTGLQVACYNEDKISFISLAKTQSVVRNKAIYLGEVNESRITCHAYKITPSGSGSYYLADRNLGAASTSAEGNSYTKSQVKTSIPSSVWGPGWSMPYRLELEDWANMIDISGDIAVTSGFYTEIYFPLCSYWGFEEDNSRVTYLDLYETSEGTYTEFIPEISASIIDDYTASIRPVFVP